MGTDPCLWPRSLLPVALRWYHPQGTFLSPSALERQLPFHVMAKVRDLRDFEQPIKSHRQPPDCPLTPPPILGPRTGST